MRYHNESSMYLKILQNPQQKKKIENRDDYTSVQGNKSKHTRGFKTERYLIKTRQNKATFAENFHFFVLSIVFIKIYSVQFKSSAVEVGPSSGGHNYIIVIAAHFCLPVD